MKLDGELGYVKPNPPLGDIVSDMGALEQEEKLCCKGVVCDPIPWNVSDFDYSMSDDSLKDFEEPIEALCTKEMDEFCNATKNESHDNNNNNLVKDICVDDGVAVTSLGQILFGHKKSRARRDLERVDMEIVPVEEVSEGFDFVLAGEDSDIGRKKSAGDSKVDHLCNANSKDSDIDNKKLPEESKTDNIFGVIIGNAEESSMVKYKSTEETKTCNDIADNAKESNIVSYGSTEVSKNGNPTAHSARESNIASNKNDNICSVIAGTTEESSIVNSESTGESKTGNTIAYNIEESNNVSNDSTEESKTSNAIANNVEESSIVSNDLTEDSKTGNTIADNVEESNIINNDSTKESKTVNAIADSARELNIVSNKTDNLSNVIAGNAAELTTVSDISTEELKIDNLCSVDTENSQNNDFGHFHDLKDGMIHRESSFSIAGPLSGLITYSGPIAYSGSCSLRSDSSTTSTRSFAFPVLQAEWSSSPVRMRAADRRKHRSCWRQGLLCCRF